MQKTVRTLMLSSALLYSGFAAAQATAVDRPQQLENPTLDPSVSVLSSPLEKWHQQFLHDARASNWSSMAQAQIESSLHISMGSTIELVSVRCAGSVCEIQAASNSVQVNEKAASEWQATLSKIASESWWQSYGFDSQNYAQSIASDGRAVFVSYFNRAAGYTP
jgi:hypothetical protein